MYKSILKFDSKHRPDSLEKLDQITTMFGMKNFGKAGYDS